MPQMAPLMWMLLFISFIIIFLMFNVLNYFNYSSISGHTIQENNPIKKNYMALFWKW